MITKTNKLTRAVLFSVSSLVFLQVFAQDDNEYCIPSFGFPFGYIQSFVASSTLGAINNVSNAQSPSGYGDFTTDTLKVPSNGSFSFELQFAGGSGKARYSIWIDWDNNGTFETTERESFSSSLLVASQGNIVVPENQQAGAFRMRVRASNGGNNNDACLNFPNGGGEVEDYTVEVIVLNECSGLPQPGVAAILPPVPAPGESYSVVAEGFSSNETGLIYIWEKLTSNSNEWVEVYNQTQYASLNNEPGLLTDGDFVHYRLKVICGTDTAVSIIAMFVLNLSPCSDQLSAGEITITPPTNNPGQLYTVSAQGFSENASGLRYIWEKNTSEEDGWIEIYNEDNYQSLVDLSAPPIGNESTIQYRLKVVCGADTVSSNIETFTTQLQYCVPLHTLSAAYTWKFTTHNGIDNVDYVWSSQQGAGGYNDLSNDPNATIAQYGGWNIDFTHAFASGSHVLRIWIDWNNNGIFETDEESFSEHSTVQYAYNGTITIPNDKLPGLYKMRVRAIYSQNSPDDSSVPTPCDTYQRGQAIDFTLQLVELTPCSLAQQPITAGTIAIDPPMANVGQPYSVTATDFSIYSDLSYTWEYLNESDNTWLPVIPSTSTYVPLHNQSASDTQGDEMTYRLKLTCQTNDFLSNEATFTTGKNYCVPYIPSANGYIKSFETTNAIVNIANITNARSSNGYGNFTTLHMLQTPPNTTINFNASFEGYNGFSIWVDWNDNGIFEDGERVFHSSSLSPQISDVIQIPANQQIGEYRMRILCDFASVSPNNPCPNSGAGEVEDYTIKIIDPNDCFVVKNVSATTITSASATISWEAQNEPAETAWEIIWGINGFTIGQNGQNGQVGSYVVNNTPELTIENINAQTQYDVYVRAICAENDSSTWTTISFITEPTCKPITDLTANILASSSMYISWNAQNEETTWDVVWGLAGFELGDESQLGSTQTTSTNITLTELTFNLSYEVYVRAACSQEDASAWTLIDVYLGYCIPVYTNPDSWTSSFTTNALTNANYTATSQQGSYGYKDITMEENQLVSQYAGTSFDYSHTYDYTTGTAPIGHAHRLRIWIDWNNNLLFENEEEIVNTLSNSVTQNGTIHIPQDISAGIYRMRIRTTIVTSTHNPPLEACSELIRGQAIDLLLSVLDCPHESIEIMGNTTICQNESEQLSATSTSGIHKWTSVQSTIVSVDENSGFLQGIKEGTSEIMCVVSHANGCTDTATTTVTVVKPITVSIITYPLNPPDTIYVGDEFTYEANTVGTWKSENTSIADFEDENIGIIKAYNEGITTILFTEASPCQGNNSRTVWIVKKDDGGGGVTGVEDINFVSNVFLFPNPANTEVNIEFTLQNATDMMIEVLDMHGKVLETRILIPIKNEINELSLDVSDYASGIYSIAIRSANAIIHRKVMIQK